jgi:hypothetical protein
MQRVAMLTETEMLSRIREKDWSKTPLGPESEWSPSLKIAVHLILASGFPMAVRWGPELVMIYNDGYVPILGDKHPAALGVPLRAVWSEIYDELGPLSEAILKGERGAFFKKDHLWRIRRHGELWEDARFTISYSPIMDDRAENGIGGILTTCVETTDRVEGQRKLLAYTHTSNRKFVNGFSNAIGSGEFRTTFSASQTSRAISRVSTQHGHAFSDGTRTRLSACT